MRKVEIKKMPVLLLSGYVDVGDSEPSDYQITIFKTGKIDMHNKAMVGIVYEDAFGEFHLQERTVDEASMFYDIDKKMLEEMIGLPYDNC